MSQNETPMYLVPGRLTDEQRRDFFVNMSWDADGPEGAEDMIDAIGTPIRPCADVETVGYAHGKYLSAGHAYKMINPIARSTKRVDGHFDTALVRRTDMEEQVALAYEKGWAAGKRDARNQQARVAAEKDAEIAATKALLRPILTKLDYAAHELEQTEHAQSVHQLAHICLSLLSDEESIRQSAFAELAALKEGS